MGFLNNSTLKKHYHTRYVVFFTKNVILLGKIVQISKNYRKRNKLL